MIYLIKSRFFQKYQNISILNLHAHHVETVKTVYALSNVCRNNYGLFLRGFVCLLYYSRFIISNIQFDHLIRSNSSHVKPDRSTYFIFMILIALTIYE